MPVIRHVRITPLEAEQLREIRVRLGQPWTLSPEYTKELWHLLLRLEQDASGVKGPEHG